MKKRVKSMRTRLLIPLAAILLIQTSLLALFYQYGGVVDILEGNAVSIFEDDAQHGRQNMEREMLQRWMNDITNTAEISRTVDYVLFRHGCTAEDIRKDAKLNQLIIYDVIDELIDRLHYSYGNGIYLILDGPSSVSGEEAGLAGVAIRDLDASSYALDHSDLLLERGNGILSSAFKIPVDSCWEEGFCLEQVKDASFYRKPFEQAAGQKIPAEELTRYAYLGTTEMDSQGSGRMLSYSLPLTLLDGTVIGVVGGEMAESRVREFLSSSQQIDGNSLQKLVAKVDPESGVLMPVITTGRVFERYFGKTRPIVCTDSHWDSVRRTRDLNDDVWYVSVQPLNIYAENTVFSEEKWVYVCLQQEDSLMADVNGVQKILLISIVVSLLAGLAALLLAGNMVTGPIKKLLRELRRTRMNEGGKLQPIGINEVDELVDAINRLSADVAEYASKITQILEISNLEIGVFEYKDYSGVVFCSRSLLKLLGQPYGDALYEMLDKAAFTKCLSVLKNPVTDEKGKIYECYTDGTTRYIRLKYLQNEKGSMTGALIDVTMEVNEKRKIERERNFDYLTNLYNRRAFRELVEPLLKNRRIGTAAFVVWDLDNLKYVNDTYGHEAGDRYICLFADHLRSLERDGAIVERRSGDEFAAFLYNGSEQKLWTRIQEYMEQLKGVTLEVSSGYQIPLRASAGVAWYPRHAMEFETLAQYADFAMYMAKHNAKGSVQEFHMDVYQENFYLLSGREELNQVLESRDVKFAMQPIVARDGSVFGYEMLMRPQLKKLKSISELLYLAKLQAKLPQIETLTWFGAMEWIQSRLDVLEPDVRFFINSIASVSMTPGMNARLEEEYRDILPRIVLEITETEEVDHKSLDVKTEIMKRWGAMVALDDYGAGYSNDGILLQLEPNVIKMDLKLVRGIHMDEKRQTMAKNLITYCHPRDILVVAEGIESPEELEFLMEIGVDLFQGYYLARPSIELQSIVPGIVQKMQELSQK